MMAELDGRRGGTHRWTRIRGRIMARDGGRCVKCGGPGDAVDHIMPRAAGGDDTWQNLQTLCNPCHRTKTISELRTLSQLPRKRRKAVGPPKQPEIGSTEVFLGLNGTGSSPFEVSE